MTRRFLAARLWFFGGILAVIASASFFRAFAVDDALISVRYARNIANGFGWRFNHAGAPTDGVTPLPWPLLLALLSKTTDGAVRSVFDATRAFGFFAHVLTMTLVLRAVEATKPTKVIWTIVLLSILLALPTSAYAASGMETPIAGFLATAGALLPLRPDLAATLLGSAAAFRPELAPWAMAVALGYGRTPRSLLIALAPPVACALVRLAAFGSPAPLAVMAKPSDFASGAAYVATALAISIVPLLLFAPRALVARASNVAPQARVLAAAFVVHAIVVVFVGGDWMPFARLFAPVLPSSLVAFVLLAPHASRGWTIVRAAFAFTLAAAGLYSARSYLHLLPERLALAEAAKPLLHDAQRVASLDIGWPTLATDADFVDLAGLTDPAIAALPGGHTSKRVDAMFLMNRRPDIVLLYTDDGSPVNLAAWPVFHYPRIVEARLVDDPRFTKRVEPVGYLSIGSSGYVVLRVPP